MNLSGVLHKAAQYGCHVEGVVNEMDTKDMIFSA